MGGVDSARRQNSSPGEGAVVNCLGAVRMEEEVQDRVQVEVGREALVKERHTERNQAKNTERTDDQSTAHRE